MCNLVSSATEQIPGFFSSPVSHFLLLFIFHLKFFLSKGLLHSVVTEGGLCSRIVLLPSFLKITGSGAKCKLWPFLSHFSTLSLNFVIKFYCFFLLIFRFIYFSWFPIQGCWTWGDNWISDSSSSVSPSQSRRTISFSSPPVLLSITKQHSRSGQSNHILWTARPTVIIASRLIRECLSQVLFGE